MAGLIELTPGLSVAHHGTYLRAPPLISFRVRVPTLIILHFRPQLSRTNYWCSVRDVTGQTASTPGDSESQPGITGHVFPITFAVTRARSFPSVPERFLPMTFANPKNIVQPFVTPTVTLNTHVIKYCTVGTNNSDVVIQIVSAGGPFAGNTPPIRPFAAPIVRLVPHGALPFWRSRQNAHSMHEDS